MTRMFRPRAPLAGGLWLALAAGAGCSSPEESVPDVQKPHEVTDNVLTGRVLINETTPMPTGYVYVYRDGFKAPVAAGPIGPDGAYRVADVPAGEVQLVVTPDASGVAPHYPGQPDPGRPSRRPPPTRWTAPPAAAKRTPPSARTARPKPPGPATGLSPESKFTPEVRKLLEAVRQKFGNICAPGVMVTTIQPGQNAYPVRLQVP